MINMIGVVYSMIDPAGVGIARYLIESLGRDSLSPCRYGLQCLQGERFIIAGFREDVIYFDFLDEVMPREVDFYVVLSRHKSEAGVKSYTTHATGNFTDETVAGGRPKELGIAHPKAMWFLLRALYRVARTKPDRSLYEISYEATHHGPTNLTKPLVFIEIGSSEEEWRDPLNHEVVGEAVLELLKTSTLDINCQPVIGIGGGHYPRKHTELALSEDVCYGHIASKHSIKYLNEAMLKQMVDKTHGGVIGIVVEKKGVRRELRDLIEEFAKSWRLWIRYV
jgi:D-aminoacyl-tRNA deacylase